MAADRRPGNLAHLERLLNAWSRDNTDVQATAGRLRRLVAISVLATILDGLDQGGAPRLAFKGGASMEMRFGVAARASRDVDALVNVSLDDAFAEIGERLNAGWEGFTGKLTERTEVTRVGITPAPQRCKIKLAYYDRPFATLAFELSRAEANSFELLEQIPNAVDMEKVQLGPAADVVVLSVHYQIAQKLHACTEVPARVPTRVSTTSTTFCCSPASWRTLGSLKPGPHARTPSRTAASTRGRRPCRLGTTGSSSGTRWTCPTTPGIPTRRTATLRATHPTDR